MSERQTRRIMLLLLLTLFLTVSDSAQTGRPVGMRRLNFADASRQNWTGTGPRPIVVTVWYPAAVGAKTETIAIPADGEPIFVTGTAAAGAEVADSKKKYPLILLSHGTGGSAMTLMWLGQALAERGYIVAGVDHHGNTAAEPKYQPQGFILWWERADDLTVALNELLKDKVFGARIDAKRIGAAGFSLGGTTVTAIGGGIFDRTAFDRFCASPKRDATCDPQPEFKEAMTQVERLISDKDPIVARSMDRVAAIHKDPRVRAVFAIAPALGYAFTVESLARIKIPFEFVAGAGDTTAPAATNAQVLAARIRGSKVTVLPGKVGHYTMLSECTDFGRSILPLCNDEAGVDRGSIHRDVGRMAIEFFDRALK